MNIGIILAALGVGAFALMGKKKASEDVVSAPPKKKKPVASQQAAEPATPKSKYRMVIWTDLDPPPANGRFVQDLASVGIRLAKVVKVSPQAFFRRWSAAEGQNVTSLLITHKEPTIAVVAFSRPVADFLLSLGQPISEEDMWRQFQWWGTARVRTEQGLTILGEGGDSSGSTIYGAGPVWGSELNVLTFDQWLSQEQPWSEMMADSLAAILINDEIPR